MAVVQCAYNDILYRRCMIRDVSRKINYTHEIRVIGRKLSLELLKPADGDRAIFNWPSELISDLLDN